MYFPKVGLLCFSTWKAACRSARCFRMLLEIVPMQPQTSFTEEGCVATPQTHSDCYCSNDVLPLEKSFQASGSSLMISKARPSGRNCCRLSLAWMIAQEWSKPGARRDSCSFRLWRPSLRGGAPKRTLSDE